MRPTPSRPRSSAARASSAASARSPAWVAGGLIIGIINYGMTVLMLDSSLQKVVMGALIIIAVTLDHFVTKSIKK